MRPSVKNYSPQTKLPENGTVTVRKTTVCEMVRFEMGPLFEHPAVYF